MKKKKSSSKEKDNDRWQKDVASAKSIQKNEKIRPIHNDNQT